MASTGEEAPRRPRWSLRSMLVGITAIGLQLGFFGIEPLLGALFFVFVVPPLLLAWLQVAIGLSIERLRFVATILSLLLFAGVPALLLLHVIVFETEKGTSIWLTLFFLTLVAISGVCLAMVHYFITMMLFRLTAEGLQLWAGGRD